MRSYALDPGLEIRRLRESMPDRRERIATAALAGMLADPARDGNPKDFAKYALEYADALIAELDKEVKP